MKMNAGAILGTGAIVHVAIGYIPDFVKLATVDGTVQGEMEWNKFMKGYGGIKRLGAEASPSAAMVTSANGISKYLGESNPLSATSTSIYVPEVKDQRDTGAGDPITTWTLDTSANKTGHFDNPLKATELIVGAGAEVWIRDELGNLHHATITSLTSDGDAADNVTLDEAVPSGTVEKLLDGYRWRLAKSGELPGLGFTLAADANVNEDGKVIAFTVGTFD